MRARRLQTYCLDLMLAGRQWRRLADAAVRPHGLSDATAHPLILIARQGGMRQTALAEAVGVEGPSLVRSLDQLCAAGLVRRVEDVSDRRAKRLHLTDKGRALTERITRDLDALRFEVLGEIDDADIESGLTVFRRIAAAGGGGAGHDAESAA